MSAVTLERKSRTQNDFETDNDSLYVMPLAHVPFATRGLSRGRLRMTGALDSVIDIYGDERQGRGFIPIAEINHKYGAQTFGWDADGPDHPDLALLNKVAELTSYDVYSLRILFRILQIEPVDASLLALSKDAKLSLSAHLKRFTAPLILNVYGDVSALSQSGDPIDLIRNPNRGTAVSNLQKLADGLEIDIRAIPEFLEKFSDCFLSISYFERYLHDVHRDVFDIVEELEALRKNRNMQTEPAVRAACEEVSEGLQHLISSALCKIERFHKETASMWQDLNAKRFAELSGLVEDYQVSVAGVLCGLGIKTGEWRRRFATTDIGGPVARADALMSCLRPGLDRLRKIDGIVGVGGIRTPR
tara:strand:+ start:700 stop:1779 length:1080 start_codon:yes stop_codon:yes gene_type:complete